MAADRGGRSRYLRSPGRSQTRTAAAQRLNRGATAEILPAETARGISFPPAFSFQANIKTNFSAESLWIVRLGLYFPGRLDLFAATPSRVNFYNQSRKERALPF